jgi:hypothetical protein
MAGFFINKDKSVWEPSRRLPWLGFIWDLNTFSLEIPLEKITRFKNDIILAMSNFDLRFVIHIDSFIPIATSSNSHQHISTHYSAYITVTWYKRNDLAGDLC